MNILMVVAQFYGGVRGGNPDVVDLAIQLQKRGHTVAVLTLRYKGDLPYENDDGVKIFRIKPIFFLPAIDYGISFPILALYRLIKNFRIDIVHGIMEEGSQTLSAMVVSKILKKPFILTIQGAVTTSGYAYVDAIIKLFHRTIGEIVSLFSKNVIVACKNLQARLEERGFPKEKIRVIPYAPRGDFNPSLIDAKRARAIRKEMGFDDKIVIGFCGRLVRLKGWFFLLCAQKILQEKNKSLHLLIIGDGPDTPSAVSMSQKLNLNLTITGYVKRDVVPLYLSATDVFVQSSLTEGLPLMVMEAMAMERAVVATDVGGTSDLIINGVNGFLVPPGDAPSLAKAIETLILDTKLRSKMGRAGRETITRNFNWNIIVQKIEKIYQAAL